MSEQIAQDPEVLPPPPDTSSQLPEQSEIPSDVDNVMAAEPEPQSDQPFELASEISPESDQAAVVEQTTNEPSSYFLFHVYEGNYSRLIAQSLLARGNWKAVPEEIALEQAHFIWRPIAYPKESLMRWDRRPVLAWIAPTGPDVPPA